MILGASRSENGGYSVIDPQYDFMSEEFLKWMRVGYTGLFTGLAGYTIWKNGISTYVWYISDWGLSLSLMTMWLLTAAHFLPTLYPTYEAFTKLAFEVAFPLEMVVTILYWATFYQPGWWIVDEFSSWAYPIFMHVLPLTVLAIDWIFNSITFDWKQNVYISMWLVISYLPLTYFGEWIMGYYPYSFVNYEDGYTAMWLAITAGLNYGLYYGTAFLTNYIKGHSGLPNPKFIEQIPKEFANLMQLAGL
jgi:hypothetical protein